MAYTVEQLRAMSPANISECSQKHVQSVVAELIETALSQPASVPAGRSQLTAADVAKISSLMHDAAIRYSDGYTVDFDAEASDFLVGAAPQPAQADQAPAEAHGWTDAADWLERESRAVYGVCLREHDEAAQWLRDTSTASQVQPKGMPIVNDSWADDWLTNRAELNPHTINLVVRFARALAQKLAAAEKKYGYSDGWRSPDWMDECRAKLMEHVAKGDPRDVAAYCAFLWHHGESTAAPAPDDAKRQLNLNDPAVQKRLAAQWGYVQGPAPAHGTPRSDELERVRKSLGQERTPAYGDALKLCRELEAALRSIQSPAVGAPQPEAQPTNRREFEVHAAERGFELERYPQGPYVSFNTDKHWETWRAALAAPSAQAEQATCPHTGQCHPGFCPCSDAKRQAEQKGGE